MLWGIRKWLQGSFGLHLQKAAHGDPGRIQKDNRSFTIEIQRTVQVSNILEHLLGLA